VKRTKFGVKCTDIKSWPSDSKSQYRIFVFIGLQQEN